MKKSELYFALVTCDGIEPYVALKSHPLMNEVVIEVILCWIDPYALRQTVKDEGEDGLCIGDGEHSGAQHLLDVALVGMHARLFIARRGSDHGYDEVEFGDDDGSACFADNIWHHFSGRNG